MMGGGILSRIFGGVPAAGGGVLGAPPAAAAVAPPAASMPLFGGNPTGRRPLQFFRDNPATVWSIASALMNNRGPWRLGDLSSMPAAIQADSSSKKDRQREQAIGDYIDTLEKSGQITPDIAAFFRNVPDAGASVVSKMLEEKLFPPEAKPIAGDKPLIVSDGKGGFTTVYTPPTQTGPHVPGAPMTPEEKSAYGYKPDEQIFWDDKGIGPAKLSGGVTVNNNIGPSGIDYGDPEPGLSWARNPDGTVKLDERGAPIALPYQGGSVYTKEVEAGNKADQNAATKQITSGIVTTDVDRALKIMDDHPWITSGMMGFLLQGAPGSPTYDLAELIKTVKANAGFDKLQAMRAASPTGGALGQVSNFENELLQAVFGSLDIGQGGEQLRFNLNRVRQLYGPLADAIVNGVRDPSTGKVRPIQPNDPLAQAIMGGVTGGGPTTIDGYTIEPVQ